jgi:hypothetical protein
VILINAKNFDVAVDVGQVNSRTVGGENQSGETEFGLLIRLEYATGNRFRRLW